MSDEAKEAPPRTELERALDRVRFLETCGIVELSVTNPNIRSYMDEWEGRVLREWQPMDTAPRVESYKGNLLAIVEGAVRIIQWGRASHGGLTGWCLADQGVEEFFLCEPKCWQPLPTVPREHAETDGWILVSEARMPKPFSYLWTFDSRSKRIVVIYWTTPSTSRFGEYVTFWRPIERPEPPEGA